MRQFAALLLLLAGCSSVIEGEVRDAGPDRPIANARVEISTSGWGRRNGQLVWDKEYHHSALSGRDGKFLVKGVDGGHRLAVQAEGYRPVNTSLCSRSPMTVRLGGPFEGTELDRQLRLGTQEGWRFARHSAAPSADADLALITRPGDRTTRFRAPAGMAFVAGTGNPPTPPQSGYMPELELDLLQCGWLFVRFEGGVAAVRIGSMATEEPLEGGRYLLMSYGVSPA